MKLCYGSSPQSQCARAPREPRRGPGCLHGGRPSQRPLRTTLTSLGTVLLLLPGDTRGVCTRSVNDQSVALWKPLTRSQVRAGRTRLVDGGILFTAHGGIWTGEVTGLRRSKKCLARSCRGATGPLSACGLPQTALTRGQLSFAPSLDRFFANLFFFLWSGLDSRIISSSSNVGSQFNLPFCKENMVCL